MNEIKKKIVMYAPHCVRGEIIALLYNHAAQKKSNVTITSEDAESFVVKELGMVRTLDGKIVPCQDGFIGMINGIPLNITCHKGSVDVSEYPLGDGDKLINGFIVKRLSDMVRQRVQSADWKSLEP